MSDNKVADSIDIAIDSLIDVSRSIGRLENNDNPKIVEQLAKNLIEHRQLVRDLKITIRAALGDK